MKQKILSFVKKELVLCIAAVCALLSMLLCPPSKDYLGYIDFRTLCLLFCLMAVVAGVQACGLFDLLAYKLLSGKKSMGVLCLTLTLLPFFCAMLITNDVALLTFVPFTVLVLKLLGQQEKLVPVLVLQTVAANLGSMATPVGNPQNLFLYSCFDLAMGDFLAVTLPLTAVSLIGVGAAAFLTRGDSTDVLLKAPAPVDRKKLLLFAALFVLCLLSVLRVLNYWILLIIVCCAMLIFARKLFRKVDYCLLLTFVCFFIFAGNLGASDAVRGFLTKLMGRQPLLASLAASQIISNVPAAVLLSGFTENWRALLAGTDIGGLGTPIASLASLITLKLYLRTENASAGKFMPRFLLVNVIGLAVLLAAAWLLVPGVFGA